MELKIISIGHIVTFVSDTNISLHSDQISYAFRTIDFAWVGVGTWICSNKQLTSYRFTGSIPFKENIFICQVGTWDFIVDHHSFLSFKVFSDLLANLLSFRRNDPKSLT